MHYTMKTGCPLLVSLCFFACRPAAPQAQVATPPAHAPALIVPSGRTIQSRFNPPPGYQRKPAPSGTYAAFLRTVPLHPDGAVVHYYNGNVKANPGIYAAVLTYDVGNKDLQQCADAVMRIRAEYLRSSHQADKIHFNLTNGFRAGYAHWAQGDRLKFGAGGTRWVKAAAPSESYASFRQYLDMIYSYAGTLSLSRELKPVDYGDMQIGDVLIVGGTPGHAVTVMDMAENKQGKKVYLLSQSYMPAQEIQVLQNPQNEAISPWYELDLSATLIRTPQWNFYTNQLMRFAED